MHHVAIKAGRERTMQGTHSFAVKALDVFFGDWAIFHASHHQEATKFGRDHHISPSDPKQERPLSSLNQIPEPY